MSKIKRIIEIEEKWIDDIKNYQKIPLGKLFDAIKESKPYDDSGDLISRSALKEAIEKSEPCCSAWNEIVDNAPPVHPRDNYDLGYVQGLEDGKDALIKELWNCRNELCLRCGKYEKAHRGACDDCRYNFKNMEQYKRGDDE